MTAATRATLLSEPFGCRPDGRPVQQHRLCWPGGLSVAVIDQGATVTSLRVPVGGCQVEVALGFDSLEGWLDPTQPYLGATIGRCANRIAHGRFTLDGRVHSLPCNDGPHHLHGGPHGFDKQLWRAERVADAHGGSALQMRLRSPPGDQGYPGNVWAEVRFSLVEHGCALQLDFTARCDQPTPVNLTNHLYFNLDGDTSRDVGRHRLQLHAAHFLPVDEGLIPTGEVRPVAGTPMDLRTPQAVGERWNEPDEQLQRAGGYDHSWVLDGPTDPATGLREAAVLASPDGTLHMTLLTTQLALQFYSGNFLDGSRPGRGGRPLPRRSGLCLEPHGWPDAVNHPHFPSVVLRPGEVYRQREVLRFKSAWKPASRRTSRNGA